MTAPVALRPATPTDAGAVGAILSEFIDTTPWMPRIHTRAEDLAFADTMIARGWVTLALDAGGIAGFLARDGVAIHALYVAARTRGRGIGALLLRDAMRRSPALRLSTFAANAAARRFYERAGFAVAGSTPGDNDEGLPDIQYLWERRRA